MFVGYCSKCGESIYSSDEVVRTEEGNFHYECTDEGYEDTHGTSAKQSN
uniref:Uncharacterized protein n=2 Tax=Vibrio TaxID=662 RepID=A0A0H3ZPK3_9VIBR|nr:hypothetical protein [Vibrio tasmaniensis]AKN37143.1 hypothetical protein [Vibrio genomosp. F6]